MSSRFKFRAYSKRFNKMFDNDLLRKSSEKMVEISQDWLRRNVPEATEMKQGIFLPTTDDDLIIMQYAGIKDKYGKELYEGDYVGIELTHDEFCNPLCITWNEKKHNWGLTINGCFEYDLEEFEDYIVIGNEHEGIIYFNHNN